MSLKLVKNLLQKKPKILVNQQKSPKLKKFYSLKMKIGEKSFTKKGENFSESTKTVLNLKGIDNKSIIW